MVVLSTAIFLGGRHFGSLPRAAPVALKNTVLHLAPLTLGIYLAHTLIMKVLGIWRVNALTFSAPFGVVIHATIVFALSYALVLGLSKIPVARRAVI